MKRLLIQTQLSNYDTRGKFILECDSGWNMVMGRVREMLKLNPDLQVDVIGPRLFPDSQVITMPRQVNPDLDWHYLYAYVDAGKEDRGRLNYIQHEIIPNALATRYDFDFEMLAKIIGLQNHKEHPELKYDAVYVNDPMHLRNLRALFLLKAGYKPKFYTHAHFLDNPSCPKFPKEASLWLGQCEAAIRSDYNFWQCESAMNVFFDEMKDFFASTVVDYVRQKSMPWDDGYSAEEITSPINERNIRFNVDDLQAKAANKVVIFVPNRIGGRGRSSDYTNCGKFMFELLPELRKVRSDFIVIAGNPSQKFLNSELEVECGPNGYVSLVPNALNRDEFKFVARRSHIALGLYDQDNYGGTAARECIELGCMPLWLDNFEYSSIAREAGGYPYVCKPGWSNFRSVACRLLDHVEHLKTAYSPTASFIHRQEDGWLSNLKRVVRQRCSYEETTPGAMRQMGLL